MHIAILFMSSNTEVNVIAHSRACSKSCNMHTLKGRNNLNFSFCIQGNAELSSPGLHSCIKDGSSFTL
jgi:hypothetical protein